MTRNKKTKMEDEPKNALVAMSEEAKEVPVPTVAPVTPPRPIVRARVPRLVSFDIWASIREMKEHHLRGLRAHVKNPNQSRTMEAWDKAFTSY